MLGSKPAWHYYHFRTWRIAVMDAALGCALAGYAALAWHLRHSWPEDVFFSTGLIAGVVLIRARDYVADKLDGGVEP